VLSLRGANARQTIAGIEKKLAEISPGFPKGVEAKVFYNRGNLVDKAVDTVLHALLEAIALVVVLLILFLGNLRAALGVALACHWRPCSPLYDEHHGHVGKPDESGRFGDCHRYAGGRSRRSG